MKTRAQEWLDFAKADLISCERMLNDQFLSSIIVFHSQQAVEKCFKALIEEKNLSIPRIHSLLRLYEITASFFKLSIEEQELMSIDEIYTRSRYPGEIGLTPSGKPSLQDAKRFYEIAKKIFVEISKQLE